METSNATRGFVVEEEWAKACSAKDQANIRNEHSCPQIHSGPAIGRALPSPVFDGVPESLRKTLVAVQRVSANQRVDEQKSGGLKNEFQIAVYG